MRSEDGTKREGRDACVGLTPMNRDCRKRPLVNLGNSRMDTKWSSEE